MFSRYHGQNGISQDLVRRAKRSEAAFEKLLKVADRLIIAFALRSGIGGEQIDDLLQDGRITAWNCVHAYDPKAGTKFTTFLVASLKNRFGQHHHSQYTDKRRVRKVSVSLESTREDSPNLIDEISDSIADKNFNDKSMEIFISELLSILPINGRRVCEYMLQGLTMDQIAKKMRMSKSKLRNVFDKKIRDHILEAQYNNFL